MNIQYPIFNTEYPMSKWGALWGAGVETDDYPSPEGNDTWRRIIIRLYGGGG